MHRIHVSAAASRDDDGSRAGRAVLLIYCASVRKLPHSVWRWQRELWWHDLDCSCIYFDGEHASQCYNTSWAGMSAEMR